VTFGQAQHQHYILTVSVAALLRYYQRHSASLG